MWSASTTTDGDRWNNRLGPSVTPDSQQVLAGLASTYKLIAGSVQRQDKARMRAILFHLLAQLHHVRVYGTRSGIILVAPHVFEQAIPAERLAAMQDEVAQQVQFLGGKIDRLPGTRGAMRQKVQGD